MTIYHQVEGMGPQVVFRTCRTCSAPAASDQLVLGFLAEVLPA